MNRLVRGLRVQALSPAHHVRSPRIPTSPSQAHSGSRRCKSTNRPWDDQAIPLTGYYADILNVSTTKDTKEPDILDAPLETLQPVTKTAPAPPTADALPKTDKEERLEKAKVVFGSRLAGPVERRASIDAASTDVAGVMVPPKPVEPDNCCMSGCVNCVWDVYRDDMEEWAAKSAEARMRTREQDKAAGKRETGTKEEEVPGHVALSMDDDGGGSESNWVSEKKDGEDEDLFEGIPIGIRAFMRTEKMLKEKHSKEKTLSP